MGKFEQNRPESKKVDFPMIIDFKNSRAGDMTICTSKERKNDGDFNDIKFIMFSPTHNCLIIEKLK